MLKGAGLHRNSLWLTNCLKYSVPEGKFARAKEIGVDLDEQKVFLSNEIKQVNPNVILALGEESLRFLTGHVGITMWRGSILKSFNGYKLVPTHHPVSLLSQVSLWPKSVSIMDMIRVKAESSSPVIDLPRRNLVVCYDSGTLLRFFKRFEDRVRYPNISIDIETIHCIPVCVSAAFTPSESIAFPLFNELWGNAFCPTPITDLAHMWFMFQEAIKGRTGIIGQNFKYDQPKLENLGFRMDASLVHDTMVMFHTLYPEAPKSLQMITSICTREPYYKDEGKEFNVRKDSFDKLLLYNAKDTACTLEAFIELRESLIAEDRIEFYNFLPQKLHAEYLAVEREGIKVDFEQRELLTLKYEIRWDECQRELDTLVGYPVNVNSPPQIKKLFTERWKLPLRKKYDEESLYGLSANQGARFPEIVRVISLVLEIRQVRKTIGTYLKALPDYDGRMRTSYRIVGTETGRTSTTLLKKPVRRDKIGLAFQTMTKHGDVGSDLRSMLVPG